MAQALPAVARGDAAAVIRVLEPIARLSGLAAAPRARARRRPRPATPAARSPAPPSPRGPSAARAPSGVDAPGSGRGRTSTPTRSSPPGASPTPTRFLAPHEALAAEIGHASMGARLARVRGRVEAAYGHKDAAGAAFERALELIGPLGMPYERALIELAHGQFLRRAGQRRAAAQQLDRRARHASPRSVRAPRSSARSASSGPAG